MTALAIISVVVSFAVAALLTRRLAHTSAPIKLLDHPNERSLHTRPTPRTGGLAMLAGGVVGSFVLAFGLRLNVDLSLGAIVFGVPVLGLVSFIDDWLGVRPAHRLLVHFFVAAVAVSAAGLSLTPSSLPGVNGAWPAGLGAVAAVLFIVWMINLYNFMDGMDGFAGGMALFGFGTLSLLGLVAGQGLYAGISAVIAASSAGFLLFNFPPARIFMGDVGSAVLGLLAGLFILWGHQSAIFPLWIGVLVFSPFIVDATVTLMRRAWKRERVWQAHRTHYYQRLVQLGWGHKRTVVGEYVLMFACALSALWVVNKSPSVQWIVIVAWVVMYAACMLGVERMDKGGAKNESEAQ